MERLLQTASLHETQEEREKHLLVPQSVCEQRHVLIEFVRDDPVERRIGHGRALLSLLLCGRYTSVARTCNAIPPPFDASLSCESHQSEQEKNRQHYRTYKNRCVACRNDAE